MTGTAFSLSNGATEILLVRHADATPGEGLDIEAASYRDLPLNTNGRAQARELGMRLAGAAIAAIYSSPLRRASETAQAISDAAKRIVAYDDRLCEVEIGGLDEPRHPAEFGAHLDRLAELAIAHGGWSEIPGSESSSSIRQRMRASIDAIVAEHAGKRVVVVSHAGSINAYLADVLSIASDFFFPAGNTSISTLRAAGDKRLVISLNDLAHLHRAPRTVRGKA
jgi:probable phosphoglycerate mutase